MNSSNSVHHSSSTPSSSQVSNSDNNANVNPDESKGAIPKTRSLRPVVNKKSLRINNNLDLDSTSFSDNKRNGYSRGSNYLNNVFESDDDLLSSGNVKQKTPLNISSEEDYFLGDYSEMNPKLLMDPISLQLTDSSSDDNELLSISDDGCIYTYKGDQAADLPSSFFNLELPIIDNGYIADESREDNSSPEMDFLEMDFDPGPSGDADSDSISNAEIDNVAALPDDSVSTEKDAPLACCSKDVNQEDDEKKADCDEQSKYLQLNPFPEPIVKKPAVVPVPNEVKMPWSCPFSERTKTGTSLRVVKRQHSSRGELVSPNENSNIANLNLSGKILIDDKNAVAEDKTMIWTEQEACLKQFTQIGPSSCGATAILNVLNALRLPVPTIQTLDECIQIRLRANSGPLVEYLQSRSRAGCNHRDLIDGLYKASQGRVYSRFFAMYPERVVNLQAWLGYWIKNGAVPIATLNLQKCEGIVPDSWHHQMIFGVGPKGIYLTNPLECVESNQLFPQLSSESVLLIRSEDVISRWNPRADLSQLMKIRDVRWKELNVLGQVARIIREVIKSEKFCNYDVSQHIKIPADYKAGITLAIDINSPAFTLLCQCPELPLLRNEEAASAF